MKAWRLDAALRLRTDAERRMAIALHAAVEARRAREEALASALAARESARAAWPRRPLSVSALLESDREQLRLAERVAEARRDVDRARRDEETTRAAHAGARRHTRALHMLRDREHERARRKRDAAEEDELAESVRGRVPIR